MLAVWGYASIGFHGQNPWPGVLGENPRSWKVFGGDVHCPSASSYTYVSLKPNSITLAGSELVRRWFEAGSNQIAWWNLASNQLRTSSEPATVMEFGF